MPPSPRPFAPLAWKIVIACCGWLAVADSLGAFGASYAPYFWGYFTNISNLAAALYFSVEILWLLARPPEKTPHRPLAPLAKQTVAVALMLTMLVGHCVLGFRVSDDVMVNVDLLIMHYIVPIMAALDWLLFDEKGLTRRTGPLVWAAFPLAYLVALEVAVNAFGIYMGGEYPAYGMYPYPFLQAEVLGWPKVIATCAAMLACVIALGYAYHTADRIICRRHRTGS